MFLRKDADCDHISNIMQFCIRSMLNCAQHSCVYDCSMTPVDLIQQPIRVVYEFDGWSYQGQRQRDHVLMRCKMCRYL